MATTSVTSEWPTLSEVIVHTPALAVSKAEAVEAVREIGIPIWENRIHRDDIGWLYFAIQAERLND